MRVILASKSPARLLELTRAGINAEVIVSDFDESEIDGGDIEELVAKLATAKAQKVWQELAKTEPMLVIGCDSMLELAGRAYGKPGSAEMAIEYWKRMNGQTGLLHTGHHIRVFDDRGERAETRVGTTVVKFADLTVEEITAYALTGEPEKVAGGFTIDSFGAAFVTRVEGDPHNVVGISLPLVRQILADLGVPWHKLWRLDSDS